MKSTIAFVATLGLAAAVPTSLLSRDGSETVTITFYAAAADYNVTIAADGITRPTNNGLNVNIIAGPTGYSIIDNCIFSTSSPTTFVDHPESNTIDVGPPQPIVAFSCRSPDTTCLPLYATCENAQGQITGLCCEGTCRQTKCKPNPGS